MSEIVGSDFLSRARDAESGDRLVSLVENGSSDAAKPDGFLLIVQRITRGTNYFHRLSQPAR